PKTRRSFRENMGRGRTDFCLIHRPRCCGESRQKDVHAGGAFVLHDMCAWAATCGTTNDGVNDPLSTAWGHSQGTTAGSFTPSLVQRPRGDRHTLRSSAASSDERARPDAVARGV